MASIENHGRKGWVFASILIFFILFILLWVYVYGRNGDALPDTGPIGMLF